MNAESQSTSGRDQQGKTFNGLQIPRFRAGPGAPQISSSRAMNRLVDALNSIQNMSVTRAPSDKVIITDANTVLQVANEDRELAAVTAGGGKLILYIDAVPVITIADPTAQTSCDTGTLTMENFSSTTDVDDYDIDEFGLCLSHAPTQVEITAAYNGGSGDTWPAINSDVSNLSYYWTLDESGVGSTKLDSVASLTWDSLLATLAIPALYSNGAKLKSASGGMGLNGPAHSPELGYPGTGDGMGFFFWLRVNTNATSATTQTNWLLSQFDSIGAQFDTLAINFISKNGTIAIDHESDIGPGASAFTSFAPALGDWHFIAAVWQKS